MPQSVQLGDYLISGNSELLTNYDATSFFGAGDSLMIGLGSNGVEIYSADKDANGNITLYGFAVPDPGNTLPANVPSTPASFNGILPSGYAIKACRLFQNPNSPSSTLLALAVLDNNGHMGGYIVDSPLTASSLPNPSYTVSGQLASQLNPNKVFCGSSADMEFNGGQPYPLFAIDLLGLSAGAEIVFLFSGNGSPTNVPANTGDGTVLTEVLSTAYMSSIIGRSGFCNVIAAVAAAKNSANNTAAPGQLFITQDMSTRPPTRVQFADADFSPTEVTVLPMDPNTNLPRLFVGGIDTSDDTFACYEIPYSTGSDGVILPQSPTLLFTGPTPMSNLQVGTLDDGSLEFWGVLTYASGTNPILFLGHTYYDSSTSQWTAVLPLVPILTFNYLRRGSRQIDVFVVANPNQPSGAGLNNLHSLLNYGNPGAQQLIHVWSEAAPGNSSSSVIRSKPILLPATDYRPFNATTTYLTVIDSNGYLVPNTSFRLSATGRVFAYVNNYVNQGTAPLQLQPDLWQTVTTDAQGKITLSTETGTLNTAGLLLSHASTPNNACLIETRANAQVRLNYPNEALPSTFADSAGAMSGAVTQFNNNATLAVLRAVSANAGAGYYGPPTPAGFFAISLHQGKCYLFDRRESWLAFRREHPASATGDILSDLWDDFKNAIGDFSADVGHFCAAVENFIASATDFVVEETKFSVTIMGQVFSTTLTCMEDAWSAVTTFFKAIAQDIKEVIAYVGYLFNWSDFVQTAKVIRNLTSVAITQMANDLTDTNSSIFQALNHCEQEFISGIANISGNGSKGNPASSAPQLSQYSSHHGSNFIQETLQKVLPSLLNPTTTSIDTPASLSNALAELSTDIQSIMTDFETTIKQVVDADTFQQAMSSLATGLKVLEADVIKTLFDALAACLQAVGEALSSFLQELTASINIPILSNLWQEIAGDQLSILDVAALVCAIPATTWYKIATGGDPNDPTTPFGANATQLQQASTFAEFLSVLGFDVSSSARPGDAAAGFLPGFNSSTGTFNAVSFNSSSDSGEKSDGEDAANLIAYSMLAGIFGTLLDLFIQIVETAESGEDGDEDEDDSQMKALEVPLRLLSMSFEGTLIYCALSADSKPSPWPPVGSIVREIGYFFNEAKGFGQPGAVFFDAAVTTLFGWFSCDSDADVWEELDCYHEGINTSFDAAVLGKEGEAAVIIAGVAFVVGVSRIAHTATEGVVFA